jgi:nitronate monooxygenase
VSDAGAMDFGTNEKSESKAWRDIWGAGQGIGAVDAVVPAAEVVERLTREYADARSRLL